MATSREKYFTEMFKTLTYYNYHNNAALSNENIREAIHKVTDEELMPNSSNVTADTFTSNTKRKNAKMIFTSKKLYKSDELADILKDVTINEAKYYVSNLAIVSDAQDNLSRYPKTVTHTSNGKEKFKDTSNGNFKQKILSNRTLPVVLLTMNLSIDDMILPIGGDY